MSRLFLYLLLGICISCAENKPAKPEDEILKKQLESLPKNEVSVMVLKKKPFNEELISNGKLEAKQKSILKFEVSGILKDLRVSNGDKVNKGQSLASLDNFRYYQDLEQANISLKKAKLELEDMLVGRGYDLSNKDSIPESVYEMTTLRSGYQAALYQVQNSEHDFKSTNLTAPFSGKVANLQFKEYDQIVAGTEFLTLIDDATFNVVFSIIESEANKVKLNNSVVILAFGSGVEYEGKVVSINPVVDENGTIEVRAKVENDGSLVEGMNVKVRIQKSISDQYVVPKSAIVIRQDHKVLFKYQNGKAFWTYVNVINENADSYAIIPDPNKSSALLTPGDTLIINGNLELAHDSDVIINPSAAN